MQNSSILIKDLCNMDYKETDFFYPLNWEKEIAIEGQSIKLDNASTIKFYFSFHSNGNDWYDMYISNSNGHVSLCFSPLIKK